MPSVTVSHDATTNKFSADPDNLDLSQAASPVQLTFQLDTSGAATYRFKTAAEDPTFGVDFKDNPNAAVFFGWSANDASTPTTVCCTAQNSDAKKWKYELNLVNRTTGEQVLVDPTIQDK